MGCPGAVGADQQVLTARGRDLRHRRGQHGDVVGDGVRARVPGPQHHRQRLLTVIAPDPERVIAEALLEGGGRSFLLRVGRHQGGVHVEDDGLAEVGARDLRGGQPAGQQGPDVGADLRPGPVDPSRHRGGDPLQGPPHRRCGGDRTEHLPLMAQDVDVGDGLPASGDEDRDVGKDASPVVGRGEPPPCHRPGQRVGQTDLVSQHPGRHVPGVGHHTRAVRGDRQRCGPRPARPAPAGCLPTRPPCRLLREPSRCTLHLRGAFHSSLLNRQQVQYLVVRQALSRSQAACRIKVR